MNPLAATGASLLDADSIVCGYGAADEILKGANLKVENGEMVAIIGPNGAGKSTLLKAVAGMLRLKSGRITLAETDISTLPPRERARHGIAFVPQEANVFPTMTVRENLEMGGFIDPKHTKSRIESCFARFPMLAEKRRQPARTLSGGQRQILAMAMALMVQPTLLLLDEPSAGLSPKAAEDLFSTIATIHAEGTAIAMVEQNAREALMIANRGLVLVDGRSVREGPARAMANDPEVRRLFLGG
jgi:branched-chain amino acid transport system ATP-binding protein/neutral amino acid transport system ATP-binding protein